MRRIVVVGASIAGLRACEALRDQEFDGELVVVGDEDHRPYARPPLSKTILTDPEPDAAAVTIPIAHDLEIDWRLGVAAVGLDPRARKLELAGGTDVPFDGLVVATGLRALRLPIPGGTLAGVHVLRTIDDALALRDDLHGAQRIAIAGAGLIGCEVASAARALGRDATLIDPSPAVLQRALRERVGRLMNAHHARAGVRLALGRRVEALHGDRRLRALTLDDGSKIEADALVMGIGATPNVDWLARSGLEIDDGVVCGPTCHALGGGCRIVAAGDVARWPHPAYAGRLLRVEHWAHAAMHGEAAAGALLQGDEATPFAPHLAVSSEQHGASLRVLGAPWLATRVELEDCSSDPPGFLATYSDEHGLAGVAALNRTVALRPYRAKLSNALVARMGDGGTVVA